MMRVTAVAALLGVAALGPATPASADIVCTYQRPLYDGCTDVDPTRPCVHSWGYVAGNRYEVRCII